MFSPHQIKKSDIKKLSKKDTAFYGEHGFIGNKHSARVIIQGRVGYFLVTMDHFDHNNGVIKPKAHLLLAIGGLPPSKIMLLARKLDVTLACAASVLFLRSRHHWSQALENKLISLYKEGKPPANLQQFGVTAENKAKLHWSVSSTRNKI